MANNNLYNELHKIASQAMPQQQPNIDVNTALDKYDTEHLSGITDLANTMYPEDKESRFAFWKSKVDSSTLSPAVKEAYWKTYEKIHPDGVIGAKRDFIAVTKRELETIPGLSGKEFFLRERLTNTPSWARKELDPILGELSATVANANLSKAKQVYTRDLDIRMGRFMAAAELDPDVSSEAHTDDAIKLEQLNLMTLGKVQSGRIGVYTEQGVFHPAFAITNRSDIFKQDVDGSPSVDEQRTIRLLAPDIIRKSVEGNLAVRRNTIKSQERTSTIKASEYLSGGQYNLDTWDTAFAMLPDVPLFEKISLGIKGEFAAKRIKSEKDLAQTIFTAMSKYGPYLPKDNNATS